MELNGMKWNEMEWNGMDDVKMERSGMIRILMKSDSNGMY